MVASWLNWGLGLVTSALLAREIAKRIRMDFGWLVAAAYSGFVISTEGLSGSIALSQATHGSALNIVEKVTGHGLPLSETVFTRFNLIPIAVLFCVLPIVFRYLGPTEANTVIADPERLRAEDAHKGSGKGCQHLGRKARQRMDPESDARPLRYLCARHRDEADPRGSWTSTRSS